MWSSFNWLDSQCNVCDNEKQNGAWYKEHENLSPQTFKISFHLNDSTRKIQTGYHKQHVFDKFICVRYKSYSISTSNYKFCCCIWSLPDTVDYSTCTSVSDWTVNLRCIIVFSISLYWITVLWAKGLCWKGSGLNLELHYSGCLLFINENKLDRPVLSLPKPCPSP